MARVHLLDDELINKIAAGEVVERPASVVKELVENAIDAGATHIRVSLKDGGRQLIQVQDDGMGMVPEDAILAVKRHTTSKLTKTEDLFQVATMGFRGEALASISSVSRFTLQSRAREAEAGSRISIDEGKLQTVPWQGPYGTTITIADLFYNVPARKAFLKTAAAEFAACHEYMQALALSMPQLGFSLLHNEREIFNVGPLPVNDGWPRGELALRQRTEAILGREWVTSLIYIQKYDRYARIEGLISAPGQDKGSAKHIFTFVNNRWVRDKLIRFGIMRGYHSHLLKGKFPVVLLHVDIDAALVDVNVHPAKAELRFQYGNEVQNAIALAIRESIRQGAWTQPPLGAENPLEHYKPSSAKTMEPLPDDFDLLLGTREASTPNIDVSGSEAVRAKSTPNLNARASEPQLAKATSRVVQPSIEASMRAQERGDETKSGAKETAHESADASKSGVRGADHEGTDESKPRARGAVYEGDADGSKLDPRGIAQGSNADQSRSVASAADQEATHESELRASVEPVGRQSGYGAADNAKMQISLGPSSIGARQEKSDEAEFASPATKSVYDRGAFASRRNLSTETRPASQLIKRTTMSFDAPLDRRFQADKLPPATAAERVIARSKEESDSISTSNKREDVIPWDELRYVGAFARCFLFFEYQDQLLAIDQHAFHERVLYERLARDPQLLALTQPLLMPEVIEFRPSELVELAQKRVEFEQCGIRFQPVSDTEIEVTAIPSLLVNKDLSSLLHALLNGARNQKELAHDMLSTLACHAAVRAGEDLPEPELKTLLREAQTVDFYHNCPHGRRVFRWWKASQVAAWFDRLG